MRMPFSHFLSNGDLKFVIILFALLIVAFFYFFKKTRQKEDQQLYNAKIKKISYWTLLLGTFSLLLGLLHSFYLISKANGIATNLLFDGLSRMLITPTLAVAITITIRLLSTPIPLKSNT